MDFGPYNAMDGEKVSVKELSADSDSIEGGTRTAYDISAGERTEFDGLLTITLPYDESETDSTDEEGSVLAEYYNRETGEWELVNYTVNITDNTVNITTDHLSEYCTVTLRDAGSPYALLSKFSSKRLDDETALAILQEFEASGKPGEVGDSLLRGFYKQFLPIQYQPGKMLYEYIRYLAVNQLSPGKWQVDETGETIEYVLHSFDASDQQSKRLESPSGRSFLEEARSFATEMGIEMYDGHRGPGLCRAAPPTSLVPDTWLYPTGGGSVAGIFASLLCHDHVTAAFPIDRPVFGRRGLARKAGLRTTMKGALRCQRRKRAKTSPCPSSS